MAARGAFDIEPAHPRPVAGIEREFACGWRRGDGIMGGQDDRFGQFDTAVHAVDTDRIEEGRAIRADLEAEVVVAEKADQRAGREAGLEGEGGIVRRC